MPVRRISSLPVGWTCGNELVVRNNKNVANKIPFIILEI
jgi:hypothetical protein